MSRAQLPRFLVTAGNTREKIDRVRDWGNIFTGQTGLRIAQELAKVGSVDLLTSNRGHLESLSAAPNSGGRLTATGFSTHAELREALDRLMSRVAYDAVFMTAAVSDYRPAGAFEVLSRREAPDGSGEAIWTVRQASAGKIKSHFPEMAVLGERTEKLVDLFRSRWNHRGLLIKFKLEVGIGADELIGIGQESRKSSGADYLVANTLEMVEGPSAGAYLLSDAGAEWVMRQDLAGRLLRLVVDSPLASPRSGG